MNINIKRLFKTIIVASSLFLIFNFIGGVVAAEDQNETWQLKVESQVLTALSNNNNTDVRVRFSAKADLSLADTMDWSKRGWFVYKSLKDTAYLSQQRAIAYLVGRGIRYKSFFAGNDLYIWEADYETLRTLASLPEVTKILAPRTITISDDPAAKKPVVSYRSPLELVSSEFRYSVQFPSDSNPEALSWAVSDVKADQFWDAFNLQGEGILVANIDTGVQWDHPALINSYKCQENPGDPACWWDPDNYCGGEPCDNAVGHGTSMLGAMVGDNDEQLPYQVGIAPAAQWIACKGCGEFGCTDYALTACAEWVIAPGGNPENRPHLVSNGWGGQGCDNWFSPYTMAWMAAGIASTFSPGASGPACNSLGSPADYMEVFASTAHDQNRLVASFASRGPSCFGPDAKPNISAPGVILCLPVPTDNWNCGWSGTSFSNAYGAGSLALLLSCAPSLQGDVFALFDALQDTADIPPAGNCGAPPGGDGNYTYGHGYINMLTAGETYCETLPSGFLEGHVFDALSIIPIEGVSILAEQWDSNWQELTTTDSTGYYTMTLRTGTYTVTAEYPFYTPEITSGIVITTDQITNLDFYLLPQAHLYGFVTDYSNGSPLVATIQVDGRLTETNPIDGSYELFLDEGTYEVVASAPDYITQTMTISLTSGASVQQDFKLVPEGFFITPTASFGSNSPIYLGETALFTDTSDLGNPPEATFYWEFGDSLTSTLENPAHLYSEANIYTVTLEVCNPAGCDQAYGIYGVLEPQEADLSVEKVDVIDPIKPGENITYEINIRNNGSDSATKVIVTDTPAYNFLLISASDGCLYGNDQITCSYAELAAGDELTLIIILQPQDEAENYINQVAVSSDVFDPSLENNIDDETTDLEIEESFTLHIPLVMNE